MAGERGYLERDGEEEAEVGSGGRVGGAAVEELCQEAKRFPGHMRRGGGLLTQYPEGPGTHGPSHPLKPCSTTIPRRVSRARDYAEGTLPVVGQRKSEI